MQPKLHISMDMLYGIPKKSREKEERESSLISESNIHARERNICAHVKYAGHVTRREFNFQSSYIYMI